MFHFDFKPSQTIKLVLLHTWIFYIWLSKTLHGIWQPIIHLDNKQAPLRVQCPPPACQTNNVLWQWAPCYFNDISCSEDAYCSNLCLVKEQGNCLLKCLSVCHDRECQHFKTTAIIPEPHLILIYTMKTFLQPISEELLQTEGWAHWNKCTKPIPMSTSFGRGQ